MHRSSNLYYACGSPNCKTTTTTTNEHVHEHKRYWGQLLSTRNDDFSFLSACKIFLYVVEFDSLQLRTVRVFNMFLPFFLHVALGAAMAKYEKQNNTSKYQEEGEMQGPK